MSNRYEHLHYCEYRDTETGLVASNYVDVMNEQDQKIKDLESQLAESEKEIEKCNDEWTEICDGKLETINRLIEEKHELEETIKNNSHNKWLKAEAERYKTEYQSLKGYVDQLKQQLAEKENQYNQLIFKSKYTSEEMIDFAVEQLELLKQKMANFDLPNNPKLYNNDMFCGGFDSHYIKTKEEIDNQIKLLKGE